MKILAIRGAGLASLAKEFEVDLDAPPLRHAGVFAIVGPTGAGKSTLLDALCLALFDRTPRLPEHERTRIGAQDDEERLTASDPRNVLRRGVAAGYAEVDFVGIDARRYRARWEVRRAHLRADGRVQAQALSLTDLATGRGLGGTKREVLAEIETRLGLSFAQFRRSALLAQGQFAAFLEADERERAELLERMTGTAIYGAISMEVSARAREERSALEALEAQLAGLQPLSDEERSAQQGTTTARRLEVAQAEVRLAELEAAQRHHQAAGALSSEVRAAERSLAELEAQGGLAEARRADIERAFRVEALRPGFEREDAATQRLAAAEVEHARLVAEADTVQRAAALAGAEVRARADVLSVAQRALDDASPHLSRARTLDRELAVAAQAVSGLEREAASATRVRDETLAERDSLAARITILSAKAAWIDEAPLAAQVAASAPRWIERAEALTSRVDGLEALVAERARAAERAQGAAQRATHCARDREQAAAKLVSTRARLRALELALSKLPDDAGQTAALERLLDARATLGTALERLAHGAHLAGAAASHQTEWSRAQEEHRRADEREAQLRASREALRPQEAALEAEARRDELAARARALREALQSGEACPVCGATEHPGLGHDAPSGADDAKEDASGIAQARDALAAQARELEEAMQAARLDARAAARSAEQHHAEMLSSRGASEAVLRDALTLARRARLWDASIEAALASEAPAPPRASSREPARRGAPRVGAGRQLTLGLPALESNEDEAARAEIPPVALPAASQSLSAASQSLSAASLGGGPVSSAPSPSSSASSSPAAARLRRAAQALDRSDLDVARVKQVGGRLADVGGVRGSLDLGLGEQVIHEALHAADAAREALAALARTRRDAVEALGQARAALEDARDDADAADAAAGRAQAEQELAQAMAAEAERALAKERAAIEAALRALWEPCAALGVSLPADTADGVEVAGSRGLHEALAEALRALSQARDRLAESSAAERELVAARERVATLSARGAELTDAARAAEHALAGARAKLEAARSERAGLLGGVDTDEAAAALRLAVEAAREACASAEDGARAARAAHAEHQGAHARSQAALALARAELEEARAALDGALSQHAITREDARACLALDRSELEAWQRELLSLDTQRERARAVLEERRRRLSHHEDEAPPGLVSELELRAQLASARKAADDARSVLAALLQRLGRDDEVRARRAQVCALVEERRQANRTWSALDAVLGSADGKRFRAYAQSLTLEILLAHANSELSRLAPRYALAPLPGRDLGVQIIDRELGDELRGVHSLSGGETFLVSLALALALAATTSRRVRVGTLFIDEGFGGLDPESLELALAALDALQAAGCQVGVVSHVPALADRFAARVEVISGGGGMSVVRTVS